MYALQNADFYDGNVVWINTETVDSMRSSFIRVAKQLEIGSMEQNPTNDKLMDDVYAQFRNRACLLIFDKRSNAEALADQL